MRIAIIGIAGNMGQRYKAVCEYLGHEVRGWDVDVSNKQLLDTMNWCERVIIATPVEQHISGIHLCCSWKKDFLCEKPVSKDVEECMAVAQACKAAGVDGRVVCNWKFLAGVSRQKNMIGTMLRIAHWAGADGLFDFVQPLYLCKSLQGFTNAIGPVFCVNDGLITYTQVDFDWSYIHMVKAWTNDNAYLWDMNDATNMTIRALLYKEHLNATQDHHRDTVSGVKHKVPRKVLRRAGR